MNQKYFILLFFRVRKKDLNDILSLSVYLETKTSIQVRAPLSTAVVEHKGVYYVDDEACGINENVSLFFITEKKFALKKILDKEVAVDLGGAFTRFVTMTTMSMKNENLQNFLSDTTQNFDAVIIEWLFSDVYAG